MKVTIDTKEDSQEDIRKILQILAHLLQPKEPGQPAEPVDTTSLMGMFGAPSTGKESPDTAPNFSSFLNLTKPEKKEEKLKIEFF